MCPASRRGFSLIEVLTTVAIVGLLVAIAVPSWMSLRRRAAVRAAAAEVRTLFHLTRSRAVGNARHCGLVFKRTGGVWNYTVFDDGDGDGVRSDDIQRGVDTPVTPSRHFLANTNIARIGLLPQSIRDPDGDPLRPTDSPVQFGSAAICSFNALGSSTSGTIYLADDSSTLWAVRVYGATAKVRVLRYDDATRRWEKR